MNMQDIGDILSKFLNNSFQIKEKRNNLYQIFVPLFHDDGDMMDIYIQPNNDGTITVCDYGNTLMRLSYTFEINSARREKILNSIICENGGYLDDGNICIKSTTNLLFENVMQLSQIISQVDAMKLSSKHRSVRSVFYDDMDEYVGNYLKEFHPQKNILPIPTRDDLTVDYKLIVKNKPFFLFGILGNEKALSSVISILSFQQEKISFTSIAIHCDYKSLPQMTQKKIMNAADKQFFDLDSFCDTGLAFLQRTTSSAC